MNRQQRRATKKQGKQLPAGIAAKGSVNSRLAEALHYHQLGVAAFQGGRPDLAVEMMGRAVAVNGADAGMHSDLGTVLQALGRADEAMAAFRQAIRINPRFALPHYNLGTVHQAQGRAQEAVGCYAEALRLKPDYAEACHNLGNTLHELGRLEDATAHYRRSIQLKPDYAQAFLNLGNVCQARSIIDEAERSYRMALVLAPDYAEAWSNLANTRLDQGDPAEAVICARQALAICADSTDALNNLGNALYAQGEPSAAMACYDQALVSQPDYAEARYNRSLIHLHLGNFAEGWRDYEWRWRGGTRELSPRGFNQPQWNGEPLGGRTILLHAEQGLGDTIQFCRYVPLVAADAQVVLEVPGPLVGLLSGLEGAARIVARGDSLPPFDLHSPLLSLPRLFDTSLDSIPASTPYLAPPSDRLAEWGRHVPKAGRRIGLAWAGNWWPPSGRSRSAPLAALRPLIERGGIDWHVLQKDLRDGDREIIETTPSLTYHGDLLRDFADTAALTSLMDVVVSIDTSVAHLAGALGKPTCLLLRFSSDWRWLRERRDSLWYPTFRLFRQPAPGDWDSVVAALGESLFQ